MTLLVDEAPTEIDHYEVQPHDAIWSPKELSPEIREDPLSANNDSAKKSIAGDKARSFLRRLRKSLSPSNASRVAAEKSNMQDSEHDEENLINVRADGECQTKKLISKKRFSWSVLFGGDLPVGEEVPVEDCIGTASQKSQFNYLYRKAVGGSKDCMFSLGFCYDTGAHGVKVNTESAIHWYTSAAVHSHAVAQNNLGVLYATGHRGRIPANLTEAFHWYKMSAKNKYANAQFHLGLMYMSGQGIEEPNAREAFVWFKKAAKQGHVLAIANVGALYLNGKGVQQNYKKAGKWLHKAAYRKSCVAAHNLAIMYERGYYFKQDHAKAFKFLEQSRDPSNAAAVPSQLSRESFAEGAVLMNL
jgi:TPR repeat protein